jgi:hypothetical protein
MCVKREGERVFSVWYLQRLKRGLNIAKNG